MHLHHSLRRDARPPCTPSPHTVSPLSTLYSVSPLSAHRVPPRYTPCPPSLHTVSPLSTHRVPSLYTPCPLSLHTVSPLSTHRTCTVHMHHSMPDRRAPPLYTPRDPTSPRMVRVCGLPGAGCACEGAHSPSIHTARPHRPTHDAPLHMHVLHEALHTHVPRSRQYPLPPH